MAAQDVMSPSVIDPVAQSLANVYAEAMLGLFADNDQAEQALQELTDLLSLIGSIPGASELLTTLLLGKQDRLAMIEKIFAGRLSGPVEGLVMVMAKHGRLRLLGVVASRLRHLLSGREGKVEVQVTSAAPLDQEQVARIASQLRDALGKEPIISADVDERLIGGITVRVGDVIYDASVAASLARLRNDLIKKTAEL